MAAHAALQLRPKMLLCWPPLALEKFVEPKSCDQIIHY